jgi:UDP-N-acetylglucosamine 2-epimerase
MSGVFLRELGLPEPDYHLAVGSGSHGHQTGEILKKIEELLLKEEPDVVLVYGDANSTLAGSLGEARAGHTVVFPVHPRAIIPHLTF